MKKQSVWAVLLQIVFFAWSMNDVRAQTDLPVRNYKEYLDAETVSNPIGLDWQNLALPTAMIAYGVIGIENHQLRFYNSELREEVLEHIDGKTTIDDFMQYLPGGAVYGLNTLGIKGRHNIIDGTIIYGSSLLVMTGIVTSIKLATHIERPDKSAKNSFPSGHTATAFASAEFLWQEYKDVSIWYGIAGYSVAAATGIYRIINNRHWLTDVVAGAGIGMLTTKLSYFVYEQLKGRTVQENGRIATFLPYYDSKQIGLNMSVSF
ncbi:MAG: phosphatase PAP2 family protein [Chlorobiales bacterium]|nr:phosphatase PAP2 family protein [Chlorobiales bacterium]